MRPLVRLLRDDTGAVTVDWVALTAGVIVVGIIVVFSIFNKGVFPLVSQSNDRMESVAMEIDPGSLDTSKF